LDCEDPLLHSVFNQESVYLDRTRLPQAVDAVDCLLLNGRCPPCTSGHSQLDTFKITGSGGRG
jgi:hypothetical protein